MSARRQTFTAFATGLVLLALCLQSLLPLLRAHALQQDAAGGGTPWSWAFCRADPHGPQVPTPEPGSRPVAEDCAACLTVCKAAAAVLAAGAQPPVPFVHRAPIAAALRHLVEDVATPGTAWPRGPPSA